ncbi:MAG: hypothetical protein GC181_05040 [Bacteroidetes bacterium]|nr:hypothetical protein [Bacteroidota bacterium]
MRAVSFFTFLLVVNCQQIFAQSIIEELVVVNRFWINRDSILPDNNAECVIPTDRERIRMHLHLVIDNLKSHSSESISDEARKQRNELLKELSVYAANGIFPMNTRHKERTPYFIDHRGVACAVGYMIIQSGFEELAEQIHRENNYGYLMDLAVLYPQISSWAKDHGFTLEELAWIQPTYHHHFELNDSTCYDGLFIPVFERQDSSNYQFAWYRQDSTFIGFSNTNPKVCRGESIYVKVIRNKRDTLPDASIRLELISGFTFITGNVISLAPILRLPPGIKPKEYEWKAD